MLVTGARAAGAIQSCLYPDCLVANDDNYSVGFNTKLTIAEPGLLANDEGDSTARVDVADSDDTSWGGAKVVVHANGSFTYTPDPTDPYSGIDQFDYWIEDSAGDNDFATAYITVRAVANNDTYWVQKNHRLTVAAPGVFANDLGLDPTTVTYDDTSAQGAEVDDNDDGAFDYIPPQDFVGTDTFKYDAYDLDFDYDYSATVTIVVDGTPPVVSMSAPPSVTLGSNIVPKWSGSDTSGVVNYDVQESAAPWNGVFGAWAPWKSVTTALSAPMIGPYGRTYCFRARATDRAGNVSAWTTSRCTARPLRASSLVYSAHWVSQNSPLYFAGAATHTSTKGAAATRTSVQARHLWLVVTKCPTCGTVQVRFNNVVTANVNLHSATALHQQLVAVAAFPTVRSGTVTLIDTSPTGEPVVIEGLAALRA